MNGFGRRILTSAVPAALVLAGVGYLYAELAGGWFEMNNPGRTLGSDTLSPTLRSRLPVSMAAWGFGLVALFEFFRTLWAPRPKPKAVTATTAVEDELQRLLREAEATNLTATPPPTGCPSPAEADNTAHAYAK